MKRLTVLFVIALSGCLSPPDIMVCRELSQGRIESKDPFGIITVTKKDNPVCMKEIGESYCGFCVWTIAKRAIYVGNLEEHFHEKKSWAEIKSTAVLLPVESYGEIKKFINISCKKHDDCGGDLGHWQSALDGVK